MNIHDDISIDDLTKAFNEYFEKINHNSKPLSYSDLKGKILAGYQYRINSKGGYGVRNTNLHTGKGGVILMIEEFEKAGLPAYLAQEAIEVFVKGQYHPLKNANVTKNGK